MQSFLWENPVPSGKGRGSWSHKGVAFNDNPGKKL